MFHLFQVWLGKCMINKKKGRSKALLCHISKSSFPAPQIILSNLLMYGNNEMNENQDILLSLYEKNALHTTTEN